MNVKQLDWEDFDEAIIEMARLVPDHIKGIYGVPRGGLPIAVALSHRLRLPLLNRTGSDVLWVDDIVDGGRTRERDLPFYGAFAAWVVREHDESINYALIVEDAWVIFPWEDAVYAMIDYMEYEERNAKS